MLLITGCSPKKGLFLMDSIITLIKQHYTANSFGEQIPVEQKTTVFTSIQSVSGEEWDRAGRNDLQAVFRAVMPAVNDSGERVVEYCGTRYGVYRVYRQDDSDLIELYLENKAGVEA